MTGHHNGAEIDGGGAVWVVAKRQEVRPYALTGGRTRPRHAMRLLTVLTTNTATSGPGSLDVHNAAQPPARNGASVGALAPEAALAIEACRKRACSVAEISALIGQPVLVTKIILSDLIDHHVLVISHTHAQQTTADGRPSTQLLESLLSGLKGRFPNAA